MPNTAGEITVLLQTLNSGAETDKARLLDLVYTELKRLARNYMGRERSEHTLQPTALVHEAYLRLVHTPDSNWKNRAHFFAVAANIMRQVLIDYARARRSKKRGGGATPIELEEGLAITEDNLDRVLLVDRALKELTDLHPRQAKIVELRFFAGLTNEEIAEVIGMGPRTVKRDWEMARTWLEARMRSLASDDPRSVSRSD
jgi:RNA polymerase sigma factor (TIGR02999 family)